MKNYVSKKISQMKTQKLVQNLSNTKKNINTMDYMLYNYLIFYFSKIGAGSGWKNSSKVLFLVLQIYLDL